MVKGFRYKLYSTVSDSDQLKKEEKVIFILIALLLGRSINDQTVHLAEETNKITREYGSLWVLSNI